MFKFLKKFFAVDIQPSNPWQHMARPLKYRECQYTLSELERRLNAEVQGYGTKY